MLKVQDWLSNNNNDFDKLKEEYGIKYNIYSDRVVLNYCQIDSKKNDPITIECRALILSYPNTNIILSRSFDRFFNFGEDQDSDKFDITAATIYSKEDGSLINCYHDGNELCIATRSMAFAEGETVSGPTFKELVERVNPNLLENINTKLSERFYTNHTFMLELCTPENRVVKPYGKDRLFLIGVRNKVTGEYLTDWEVDKIAVVLGIDRPEEIFLNSWDSITENISKLPLMDEGYVCNHNGWRIKIKSPAHVAISHLRENGVISPKRISKLVFLGESEEYISYFPEDYKFFVPYMDAYVEFRENINAIWLCVKDIKDQKEFAMEVKDLKIAGILFAMKKGLTIEQCISNMNDNKKLEVLNYYKE